MITLHYLQCSRSFRILWALEELGMDYQVEYYQRSSSYAALSCGACFLAIGATPNESDCGDATSLSERMLLISPESGLSHA